MTARVVKGLYALPGPHDKDGLVQDLVFNPITEFWYLLKAARHLPDMRPEIFAFELEELLVVVAARGNAFGIGDLEGRLAGADVSGSHHDCHAECLRAAQNNQFASPASTRSVLPSIKIDRLEA
jgi:hypothetical protein